jgi:hypothetical protein
MLGLIGDYFLATRFVECVVFSNFRSRRLFYLFFEDHRWFCDRSRNGDFFYVLGCVVVHNHVFVLTHFVSIGVCGCIHVLFCICVLVSLRVLVRIHVLVFIRVLFRTCTRVAQTSTCDYILYCATSVCSGL